MKNISVKRHILDFIADQDARCNYRPTRAEVLKMFAGLSDDVDLHLEQLEREGLLHLDKEGGGTISLTRTFPQVRRIMLGGGLPSGSFDPEGIVAPNSIELDLRGAGIAMEGDLFAHVVDDDSMSDAGIQPKDVAILKAGVPARGEIAVVEVSGKLVLRRYIIVSGIPHFLAENPLRPDLITAYDRQIYGVLWCLICTNPSGRGSTMPPIKKVNYQNRRGSELEAEFLGILNSTLKEGPKLETEKLLLLPRLRVRQNQGSAGLFAWK